MSAAALIRRLRERDIRLWTDGAKLRYSAPEGAMTEEIRAEVAKHRAELLAFLAAAEAANDDMPPLGRAPRGAPLPLSFAQERLWFLEQLVPDTGAYNVAKTIRFRGRLDIAALRGAFRTLAARHETLRTCFPSEDGRATQVVAETVAADLPIVDLAQLDPARRDPVARHLADSHARRAFDLRRGPLWHVLLLRLDDEEHVLSVVLHHIVFDGWSAGVLVAEIAESYRALTAGAAPNLPELPVQYADFAVWQRGWLRGERLDRELDFWRDRLAGAPPVLDLPADRRRTTVQSARGAVAVFAVDADGTAALRRLSRECGATLFMTLMTAFKVLLYRCCGQSDLVVGTPIANRRKSELERLIGFFVNMLAVRTDLGGNPSFVDALERVKSSLVDAYSHQDLPFEYLVKALGVPRDLSHAPVFQVAFQLQSARAEAIELPGLVLEQMETDDRTAKLDMTVSISEGERTLQGTVQASTDLFDRETIERLGSLYVRLLGAIAANPRIPIDGLPLLDRQEREAVLRASASPAKPVPALLQARFERLAQRTGDLVAVADRDFQLTYRELNEQAAYLARRLVAAGVRREQLIGICMPRSAETIVAMLGVLKAGAAFVPMDHTYPAERLARMIEDSRLRLVITNAAARAALPCGDYDSLALERGARADAASPAGRLAAELPGGLPAELPGGLAAELPTMEPQSLAYVIYTSGSTGMPKGALLQHDGAANFAARCIEQKLVGPHCRFMKFASIGFDASIAEVFITLNAGGCVCIVPDDARRSTDVLQDWAREQAATDAILPPTLVALLEPAAFRTMRMLTAGGEACGPEIANRWGRAARFFNAYGPTETSVGPVLGRVREVAPGERVPIGRPLANVSAYVVDRAFEVVPPGIVGEICIGGVAVGRGYLGRPDMT
ncbi:MAG: AMP-binding protein, partial [Gammaproteobacteria bacterium]|nr:AMP-binding protein [Gammaproteobacteria bacterium]